MLTPGFGFWLHWKSAISDFYIVCFLGWKSYIILSVFSVIFLPLL